MFVAFHTDAYFSLGGEVLLYFSVRVEVVEIVHLIQIQIGLEFRKDLKNKRHFSFFSIGHGQKLPQRPNLALVLSPVRSPHSSPKEFHRMQPGRPPVGSTEPSWLGIADRRMAARLSSS
jgi:hypothetical protein